LAIALRCEDRANVLGAIVENSLNVGPHQPPGAKISQCPTRNCVMDCVPDQSASLARLETVGVPPQAIRALQLKVDKPSGRVPFLNAGCPVQRQAMPGKLVIDQSAGSELAIGLSEDLEVQPRRSDSIQVARLAEKGENLR